VSRVWTALLAAGVAVAGCSELPTEPITSAGDYRRSVEVDGGQRSYLVHVPEGLALDGPLPLVLAFHGAPSNGEEMRAIAGLDDVAASEGFVVVYPEASRTGDWNTSCRDCSGAGAFEYDDIAFTETIIEKMALDMSIDTDRVYATGFSQGALMTFRVACELSDRIAAVATVGATMLQWQGEHCGLARPVPIAMVHGTDDEEFPTDGRSAGLVRSVTVEEMLVHWITADECGAPPVVSDLPDVADDGTTVVVEVWGGCAAGAEVRFYRVVGGGHTWPGSTVEFSPLLGVTSMDLQANQAIAEFFLRFTR
jgi:polyhydroxybutyrate depolymerase